MSAARAPAKRNKDLGAKYIRGGRGDSSKLLPRWREVACSECGDLLHLREDVPQPVLCDGCEGGADNG
jgi:hypothetical protein